MPTLELFLLIVLAFLLGLLIAWLVTISIKSEMKVSSQFAKITLAGTLVFGLIFAVIEFSTELAVTSYVDVLHWAASLAIVVLSLLLVVLTYRIVGFLFPNKEKLEKVFKKNNLPAIIFASVFIGIFVLSLFDVIVFLLIFV